jgi:hypothetical protein
MLKDQIDLLLAFNEYGVEYLIVGGHAVGYHSEPRGTKDLDLWIRSSEHNSVRVFEALRSFGAPLLGISPADFVGQPESVFQLGMPPSRIDVLQEVDGVDFDQAWQNRVERNLDSSTLIHVISRDDLIANKLASGRFIDLADVEKLRDAAIDELKS